MTADENKNKELKEDSQTDKTTLEQDHKVAKRKGLGRLNTILLFLPMIILAVSYLLAILSSDTVLKSPLDEKTFGRTIMLLVLLYVISLPFSLFILFKRVLRFKDNIRIITYTIITWMIFGCTCVLPTPTLLYGRIHARQQTCKMTLRALREAQQVYAKRNNGKYGTWQELVDQGLIEGQYSKDNLIKHYFISSFIVYNPSDSERASGKVSSFTITAIPKRTDNRLRTFGIGVESYPLVWVGSPDAWSTVNVSLHNIKLWEPLR